MIVFQSVNYLRREDVQQLQADLAVQAESGVVVVPRGLELIYASESGVKIVLDDAEARWLPKKKDGLSVIDEEYGYVFECSICGGCALGHTYEEKCSLRYCSSCGARMEAYGT